MTTLGVFIGNRGFFPSELCREGRNRMLKVLEEEGIKYVVLPADATPYYGAVVTYEESKKCAELFKQHREEIDGILVTLPNFGEERAIADTIRLAGLDVPVLVHAYRDDLRKLDLANRRDSFCGKMSACNNLTQYNIPYSLTVLHTVDPEDASFRQDLRDFAGVCRVVRGLRKARFGQVGARPAAFITVRYSEKLLEEAGISVESIDLSEILAAIDKMADNDDRVTAKLAEIKGYINTKGTPDQALMKQAKLGVALDDFIATRELDGTAVQCWTSLEENYGVVPCTVMSMMSNQGIPSACETDITGLVGMYAMVLAANKPAALLDWNNNYGDDPDKAIVFHCSNLPKILFGDDFKMDYQAIIAGSVGQENTYGTTVGQIKPSTVTYCRVSTDDYNGTIRAYIGEAEITDDPLNTFGGYGVIRVPAFQDLLQFICEEGYEHHVAICPAPVADILYEAMTKYLGWDVYYHQG